MTTPQQVVLITGTSSGFGRLIAETLARQNFHVFATVHNVNGKNAAAAQEMRELAKCESTGLILEKLRGSRANPQEVADAVLRIIETPAGTRALRYRIGPGAGEWKRSMKCARGCRPSSLKRMGFRRRRNLQPNPIETGVPIVEYQRVIRAR
jgi:hypothetical protein